MERLVKILKEKQLTIASCESLTGGLFASKLVEISGVSSIFVGSYVTYGGDDKLKEIANIIKVFNEEIKYLEEDTEYFKEVIGL